MNQGLPEFFLDYLNKQYEKEICEKIIDGYKVSRYTTIRVNTIKSDVNSVENALRDAGIEYEKVSWSNEALILKNVHEKELQQLDMYEKGEIYLQSLSSMLPPIILDPKPDTDILDMAAAPGGKTTQMAALTQNKAHITACEMNHLRAERLKYNIEKQGASSVYIMEIDSRNMESFFAFDSVLLDSPCSGSGTLRIDDSHLHERFTLKLVEKSTKSQLALLRKALQILKPGREMVYSTCSVLSCENEDVIKKILQETKSEIVPIDFQGIESLPTLPVKINGTLCVCPNEKYEGFFVTKIKKTKN